MRCVLDYIMKFMVMVSVVNILQDWDFNGLYIFVRDNYWTGFVNVESPF